ncbi:MAG: acyltransferase, partial [Phycisphaerales bacterium]|nr:acyltransferase [Phycisphaerales bacterium]
DAILQASGVLARPGVGMHVGHRVAIGAQSFLGGQGGIEIGDDTIMGPGVRVFSEEHVYEDPDVPIRLQGERRSRVVIGANCWIGANATILSGTHLGPGCVVAAGAVVKGTFAENSLIVGVPGRTLRCRVPEPRNVHVVPGTRC